MPSADDVIRSLEIRPFQSADQAAAKALILDGLAGHWGTLDPTLNPDLDDIAASYAGGAFFTAWIGGTLAGTGAYLPEGPGVYRIVRMSVRAGCRRSGIGSAILRFLIEKIKAQKAQAIVLETTTSWHEVIQFYTRHGFSPIGEENGDTTFQMSL